MNKPQIYILLTIFYMLFAVSYRALAQADYGNVIPLPQSINKIGQAPFTINAKTVIVYPQGNKKHEQTAKFLADYIKSSLNLNLKVTDKKLTGNNIVILKSDYKSDKKEAYNLTVNAKQIIINGADEAGTFYGVQTLWKSIPADLKQTSMSFPAVEINDYPRFGYRGAMLDVCRHFFDAKFVKKYIDLLALHNINRFHWHLTDDQGWRIEIKKYPKLTQIGSKRDQTIIGMGFDATKTYDGVPYGGFYTQDEIKEIIDYADKRFITIIPEIDIPGHTLSVLAAYPNLGCTGGPYKVREGWGGLEENVLCAGNEDSYKLLEGVFDEVIALFPSKYIHIGGDECPKAKWKECPKCQAKIKSLGIAASKEHPSEDQLQSYLITRMEKYLNSKGRQIIGWDEILEGGIAPNATVMSWRGMHGGIVAAQQHHDVIMAPNTYLYFDYYQTTDTKNVAPAFPGYNPIETVYSFNPIAKNLTEKEQKHILGVQANLWAEGIATPEHAEFMLLPRMGALSEVQWTMPEKKNYAEFLTRLYQTSKRYDALGYNYSKYAFDIYSTLLPVGNSLVMKLSVYDNAPIYYTLDGSEPTTKSALYSKPIDIKGAVTVKAKAKRNGKLTKLFEDSANFNKATLKKVKYLNNPIPFLSSDFEDGSKLTDGKRGDKALVAAGAFWLGFPGALDFVLDMNTVTDFSSVTTGLLAFPAIVTKVQYTIGISNDGVTYNTVFDKEIDTQPIKDLIATCGNQKARYIKIVVKGNAPAAILCDEIIVN